MSSAMSPQHVLSLAIDQVLAAYTLPETSSDLSGMHYPGTARGPEEATLPAGPGPRATTEEDG